MKADINSDKFFLKLINDGIIIAYKNGKIYNKETNRYYTKKSSVNNYIRVIYKNKGIQAHRIIWLAFNGLIPENMQINHINGIKHDNRLSNLELVTNGENTKHAYDIGLAKISPYAKQCTSHRFRGEKNTNSKLTDEQVIEIRRNYIKYDLKVKDISNEYGICRRTVENLLTGKSYKHLPYNMKRLKKFKLTDEQVIEIRKLYNTLEYTQKQLAELFKVSRSTIKDIVSYRTRKNL